MKTVVTFDLYYRASDLDFTVRAEVDLASDDVAFERVAVTSGDFALELDEITEHRPAFTRAIVREALRVAHDLWSRGAA